MKLKNVTVAATTALVVALTMAAPAKILFEGMLKHPNNTHKDKERIGTIRVAVDGRTLREAQIEFDVHKNVGVETSSSYLQGTVSFVGSRKSVHPAAASIIGDKVRITFPGRPTGSRHSRRRSYTVTAPYRPGDVSLKGTIHSVPSSAHSNASCAGDYDEHTSTKQIARINDGLPSGMSNVATIHTYADFEFHQSFGEKTNDVILDYVNAAEVFYLRQFNVSFRVVGQSIATERTPYLEPGVLLTQFQNDVTTQNPDVDLKHMFTGKDMAGTTIGIAYVSAICRSPSYAYGVTQNYLGGAIAPYILAHELGHNFGAGHDVTTRSIMYPSVQSFDTVKFSDQSVREIDGWLNQFGNCLSLEQTHPNIRTSTLTLGRVNRLIYAILRTESGEPFPNQKVVLFVNGRPKILLTDSTGRVRYVIRNTKAGKNRRFTTLAQSYGGEISSNTLTFRLR